MCLLGKRVWVWLSAPHQRIILLIAIKLISKDIRWRRDTEKQAVCWFLGRNQEVFETEAEKHQEPGRFRYILQQIQRSKDISVQPEKMEEEEEKSFAHHGNTWERKPWQQGLQLHGRCFKSHSKFYDLSAGDPGWQLHNVLWHEVHAFPSPLWLEDSA